MRYWHECPKCGHETLVITVKLDYCDNENCDYAVQYP